LERGSVPGPSRVPRLAPCQAPARGDSEVGLGHGDRLLEGAEWLCTADEVAVDDEAGRTADASLLGGLFVRLNARLMLALVEGLLEGRHVGAQLLGELLQVGALDTAGLTLTGEELVVVLPERVVAFLLVDFVSSFGGERRVLVE